MEQILQNRDRSLGRRILSCPWLPFVLLGCIYFVIHLFITPNMGDDVYYTKLFTAPDFDLISFSATRYLTWSSRSLIEAVMAAAILMPPILWKLIDTLMIVIIAVFLSKLLLDDKHRKTGNVVIAALMLMLPFYLMNSAGWIATTLNYLWPLALGLVALYPLRKIINEELLRGYEYILYSVCLVFAANAEQVCAFLLIIYTVFTIMMLVRKKYSIYIFVQLALCVLSLVFILTCPGNEVREVAEAAKWYPGYLDFSIFKMIGFGLLAGLKDLFLMQYLPLFAFVLVLCLLVFRKQKRTVPRIIALIPPVCLFITYTFKLLASSATPALYALFSNDNWFDAPYSVTVPLLIVMLLTISAILICLYQVFGKSRMSVVTIGLLVLGFATKAAVGLSPTVWASGERTSLFMVISFIACTVCLLNEWDFENKKATRLLLTLSLIGGMCGIALNLYYVIPH